MIASVYSSGEIMYGWKEFVVDYEKDVCDLPTNCAAGSKAFVIENSKNFMLNCAGKWIEVQLTSGGGITGGGTFVTIF